MSDSMAKVRRRFYERGPEVDAIQHDGTDDSAVKVISWANSVGIPQADIVPKGGFNNDPSTSYVAIGTNFGVGYVGMGDWVVMDASRQVRVLGNTQFRQQFVEIQGVV